MTANALVATVLGSISASVGTVESEGRQMTVLNIVGTKGKKIPQKILKKKKLKAPTTVWENSDLGYGITGSSTLLTMLPPLCIGERSPSWPLWSVRPSPHHKKGHIGEISATNFGLKILKFFYADPDP